MLELLTAFIVVLAISYAIYETRPRQARIVNVRNVDIIDRLTQERDIRERRLDSACAEYAEISKTIFDDCMLAEYPAGAWIKTEARREAIWNDLLAKHGS